MADRIKKIKVKQADGNYSDYIPIGADAKDIDMKNGNNLEAEIKYITKSYDTIEEMKLDSNIMIGDICQTFGYSDIKDGIQNIYKIIDGIDTELIDNNEYIQLNNGLIGSKIKNNILKFHSVAKSSATYIVEFQNKKTMIVDTGIDSQWTDIKKAIDNLKITKFDYVIITHCHPDHIGNVQNLIDNYNVNNAIWWIGMKPDFNNHSEQIDELESTYDNFINMLNTHNISPIVPKNDSYYNIDNDTKLHFLNTSNELAANYYGSITEWRDEAKLNFNHFSLVTEIIHKNNVFLCSGDIEAPCEKELTPFMHECKVITTPHHGVNRDAYEPFYATINPKYSISSYITDNKNWVRNEFKSFMILKEKNCRMITPQTSTPIDGLFSFYSNNDSIIVNITDKDINPHAYYARLYSRIDELINYTSQLPESVTLNDILNNMKYGSILIGSRTSAFEEKYPLLLNDIQNIFYNQFNLKWNIEIHKGDMNPDNSFIKIFDGQNEFIAHKNYDVWSVSGNAYLDEITGINNLITTLKNLPVGTYKVNYTDDVGTVLVTNGAYALDINLIFNDNSNINASISGVLRHTTFVNNNIARSIQGFIKTDSNPQYIWNKTNTNTILSLPSDITGIDNLLNELIKLPIGHYTCQYKDDIGTVLATNGFYNLSIDITLSQNNTVQASIIGILRNTGQIASSTASAVIGYINTSSNPKYIWYKIN